MTQPYLPPPSTPQTPPARHRNGRSAPWWRRVLTGALTGALLLTGCLDSHQGTRALPSPDVEADTTPRGALEGEDCLKDEDCEGDLKCGVSCEDWCDSSQWPNPCCTATCGEVVGPWVCDEAVGVPTPQGEACPDDTTEANNPADWVLRGVRCCLHEVCEGWENRFLCEASSACRWRLADPMLRPNDGTCESLSEGPSP